MEKHYLLLFLLSFACTLLAQKPVFFPEDIEHNTLQLSSVCKPGVINKSRSRGFEISFHHTFNSQLMEEDEFTLTGPLSESTQQNLNFSLRLPIVNKEGLKAFAGLIYRPEHYDFQTIGPDYSKVFQHMDGRNLKSSGFEALLMKSWNGKYYTSARIRTLFNGDYDEVINFDNRFAVYNVSAIFGVKRSEDKEWGVGLNFSSSFRSSIVLPFFMYNQTFNDKWGVEMVLPALASLRYNFSDNSIILFGVQYNSRSYSIEVEDNSSQIYNLNHSELRTGFTLEQKGHSWFWIDISGGIQYNFSTDFDAQDNDAASFEVEPGAAPYIRLGLFISPPDDCK